MNNKEAVRQFLTIQHLMWQNYHHIADNFNEPEQLLGMAKAQHEIYGVKQWLTEQAPPQPTYPDPIPIMGFQGVGGFHYYKLTKNKDEVRKRLHEIKMHRYYLNDGFMFLSDNKAHHSNLTYHTPFFWDGNRFDLEKKNPEFWADFKAYLKMHKEVGLDFCAQLWMRNDYINYPYRNNCNGVNDLWDPDAMRFHYLYVTWVMGAYREVYGSDYNPHVKVSPNEVAHHGSGAKLHEIMYFCERVCKDVLLNYTILEHIIFDLTGCEGSMGEMRNCHKCSKPGACDRGGWHGLNIYDRLAMGEKHKYSTWADFFEIQRFINSANRWRRFTEDGGGRADDGDFTVPRTGMKLGSPAQQGHMMRQLALIYQATGKRVTFCSFPHTALKKINGVFFPDYRVSEMTHTFACAKEMIKEYDKVMG